MEVVLFNTILGKRHKHIRAGSLGHVCTVFWKWGDIYRGASCLYRKMARFCPFPGRGAFTAGLRLLSFARWGSGWLMSLDAWTSSHGHRATLPPHCVPSPGLSPVPETFHVTLTDCCHLQRAQAALSIPHGLGSSQGFARIQRPWPALTSNLGFRLGC